MEFEQDTHVRTDSLTRCMACSVGRVSTTASGRATVFCQICHVSSFVCPLVCLSLSRILLLHSSQLQSVMSRHPRTITTTPTLTLTLSAHAQSVTSSARHIQWRRQGWAVGSGLSPIPRQTISTRLNSTTSRLVYFQKKLHCDH